MERRSKINWTPKAMLTLVYAAKQQREFRGLGDKGEDYGERMHQSRARNVRRTASISKDFVTPHMPTACPS